MVKLIQQLFEVFGDNAFYVLAIGGALLWNLLKAILGGKNKPQIDEAPSAAPRPNVRRPAQQRPRANAARAERWDEARRQLSQAATTMAARALELTEEIRHEPANRRFVEPLSQWVAPEAQAIRVTIDGGRGQVPKKLVQAVNNLSAIMEELESLIRQRRDPLLKGALGDADALAAACYEPVVTFARTEGLPLTSATPVTHLRGVDLSIWTGFAPTSIAPIFLPPNFFRRLQHWPALAHEIGHDFLISVTDLEPKLRAELGLGTEQHGQGPLRPHPSGVPLSEVRRVVGAWFEEFFCDLFGALMCGPAYVATMISLFAAQEDPREVLVVRFNPRTRRYDHHPPRHLRVLLCQRVLERAGLHADAKRLWRTWQIRHGLGDDAVLLFPFGARMLPVPVQSFVSVLEPMLEQLYAGPLTALNGFGLSAISGLDFGPHEQREAERVRDALLAGTSPAVHDARSVVSGAVLAWESHPEQESKLLQLARQAIPGVGTSEHRPDAYDGAAPKMAGGLDLSASAITEALLFHQVMSRRTR